MNYISESWQFIQEKLCIFPLELPFILSSGFSFHHRVGKLPKNLGVFPWLLLLVEKLQSC